MSRRASILSASDPELPSAPWIGSRGDASEPAGSSCAASSMGAGPTELSEKNHHRLPRRPKASKASRTSVREPMVAILSIGVPSVDSHGPWGPSDVPQLAMVIRAWRPATERLARPSDFRPGFSGGRFTRDVPRMGRRSSKPRWRDRPWVATYLSRAAAAQRAEPNRTERWREGEPAARDGTPWNPMAGVQPAELTFALQ